jgi:hypothetical protein
MKRLGVTIVVLLSTFFIVPILSADSSTPALHEAAFVVG